MMTTTIRADARISHLNVGQCRTASLERLLCLRRVERGCRSLIIFHLLKEEKLMETKTGQHQRRMATMSRVLSRFRLDLEKKKLHAPGEGDGDRPPQPNRSKHRQPRRRLDA
jgi:hypothetical protein